MVSADFLRQIEGYGLTTARILYRIPDHRSMLQTYLWQDYDLAPDFPVLQKFSPSGSANWTDRCIRCGWRIPASSSRPNSTA